MNLLLDGHVLLWWLDGADRLGSEAAAAIADGANEVSVSAATLWELSIKQSVGKLTVDVDLREHAGLQGSGSCRSAASTPWRCANCRRIIATRSTGC